MSGKKVGIVVFVLCILLALVILAVSNIKVTKKDTSKNSQVGSSQTSSISNKKEEAGTTQGVSATSLSSDASNIEEVQTEVSTEPQSAGVESEKPANTADSDDVVLDKIIAEQKLSYAGADQVTTGVVKDKFCYLSGSQIVYCLDIDITMGTSGQVVQYFCTYNTYADVSVGTKLSVTYKQTTDNTFALMSVSKV